MHVSICGEALPCCEESSSFVAGPTHRHFLKREGALIHHPCACIITIIDFNFCTCSERNRRCSRIDAALE